MTRMELFFQHLDNTKRIKRDLILKTQDLSCTKDVVNVINEKVYDDIQNNHPHQSCLDNKNEE